jgi:hypothetical protein
MAVSLLQIPNAPGGKWHRTSVNRLPVWKGWSFRPVAASLETMTVRPAF